MAPENGTSDEQEAADKTSDFKEGSLEENEKWACEVMSRDHGSELTEVGILLSKTFHVAKLGADRGGTRRYSEYQGTVALVFIMQ